MSLQQLAQTVQSRGRGDDSVLIHMTPKEVQGLQSLALSQGGSLTINPDTGLPEAGFLSSILPTLIGAGLSIASGGALTPLMAAGIMGGGTALLTGDLRKGLTAGLGAYGGAGLGAGLAGMGAGTAGAAAQTLGVPAATGAGSQAAMLAAQNAGFGQAGLESLAQAAGGAAPSGVDLLKAGAGAAMENPSGLLNAMGGTKQAMRYGMAAAAPMMADQMIPTTTPMSTDNERYLYQFDRPRRDPNEGYTGPYSGELQYFGDSSLTRIGMAEGGSPEDKFQMTGESKAAYDYLMGRAPVSPGAMRAQEAQAAQPVAPMAQAAPPAAAPALSGGLGGLMSKSSGSSVAPVYNFDPRTGQLVLVQRPEPEPTLRDRYAYDGGGGDGYGGFGGDGGFGGVNGSAGSGLGSDSDGGGTSMAAQGGIVGLAKGGIAGLAKGGFVVPADVVSMLGEGSTDAGLRALQAKYGSAVKPIRGPGTGQSDSIPTSIEGKQPARVADGEAYIPPAVIAKHGGAKKFYAMLDRVRTASQGHTKQQRRVNPSQVMA